MISNEQFQAIQDLDLESIKTKLMHVESGEGWSRAKADAVETEYRRFLYLMKTFPEEQTAPLVDVDTFWHYHILDTMKYALDCDAAFGYFLHHYPYVGMRGDADVAVRQRSADRMRELYEQVFCESYEAGARAMEAAGTAFCGVATGSAAFCGITGGNRAAFCGITGGNRAAFCGITGGGAPAAGITIGKAAFCGSTGGSAQSGGTISGKAGDAAFCGITVGKVQLKGAKGRAAAFCGITGGNAQASGNAFCGIAGGNAQASGATSAKAAFCGITGNAQLRGAINAASTRAGKAAFCGNAGGQASFCGITGGGASFCGSTLKVLPAAAQAAALA